MSTDKTDYTIANTYLQLLRERYQSTCQKLRDAQIEKDEMNGYIYFLVENKKLTGISNAQIAEMVGLTRERIGQIHAQVSLKLQKRGGDKS